MKNIEHKSILNRSEFEVRFNRLMKSNQKPHKGN